ncbi:MAG: SPFH domain-containing protein [Oscillospiraceae bacterium]|nr:SPFH domain-containing protein [Oscillospiraceae bacterium]
MDLMYLILIPVIIIVVICLLGYVKSPPDKAIIISGLRKKPKMLIGKAGIRIPFLERTDSLYLKQVTVPVISRSIPTKDFINVNIDAVIKVRICPESDTLDLAMKNFLNKSPEMIIQDLQDSLQGNMREIVGSLSLEELSQNKERFSAEIKNAADADMKALGVEIVTCNIQSVTDDQKLIENLGAYNTAEITKKAAIVKAKAKRDIQVAEAGAAKEANDARVIAELEIAQRNNELEIRQAELKKISDTEKAKAEAAFKIEQETQRKTIEAASVDAEIAKSEREVELKEKEAQVKERALNAEVRKQADADRYRKEQEAEVELFQRTQEAEAKKIEAQAELFRRTQDAEAKRLEAEKEAEATRLRGEAEAAAVRARGVAEAEAIREKAEAMKQYGEAAVIEMIVNRLPEIAKSVAEPMSRIDKVTIFGSDGQGVAGMTENVPIAMARAFDTVKAATGVDLTEIVRAETFEAKTTKNINFTGVPEGIVRQVIKDESAVPEVK